MRAYILRRKSISFLNLRAYCERNVFVKAYCQKIIEFLNLKAYCERIIFLKSKSVWICLSYKYQSYCLSYERWYLMTFEWNVLKVPFIIIIIIIIIILLLLLLLLYYYYYICISVYLVISSLTENTINIIKMLINNSMNSAT